MKAEQIAQNVLSALVVFIVWCVVVAAVPARCGACSRAVRSAGAGPGQAGRPPSAARAANKGNTTVNAFTQSAKQP